VPSARSPGKHTQQTAAAAGLASGHWQTYLPAACDRGSARAQVSSVEVLSPGNLFGTIRSSVNGKVLPWHVPSVSQR